MAKILKISGEHHYHQMNKAFGPGLETLYSTNDKMKSNICKEKGISLIVVPYWWNSSTDLLKELILHQRPDLNEIISLKKNKNLNIE